MKTLENFKAGETSVPMQINWLIGDLMEYRGYEMMLDGWRVTDGLSCGESG